ncbi:MAG: lamin tail domain-containing protein [Candidatus Parcubacteria bacterium]|nr:lamin tail domain-containing protein [Candidatus Parcubacteria bacterium]
MKSNLFYSVFFIIFGIFVFGIFPVFALDDSDFSTENLSKFIYLNNADAKSILRSMPQALTDAWMESVVSTASAEEEAIEVIVRKSVRDNIRDYLLIESPIEIIKEIAKIGFKFGKMALTKNISDLIGEFEKLTIKESVNFLSQWLKEKEIKIATGNLDFSYNNFQKENEKARFQYIILYNPRIDSEGDVIIKIFSTKSISAPSSYGSLTNSWGTGWNYSDEYLKGKKLPPFVLTMTGEMKREKNGYWQSDIIHSYSWKSQPNIEIEFPNNVPYFDFHEKGFLEKVGDKIKEFFGKIGDIFSGASVVDAPEIETNVDGTIDLSADSALGQFIDNILKQFRAFQSFLGQAKLNALENQAQDIVTEDELLAFMEEVESLQAQLDAMGKRINLLQASGTSSIAAELESEKNNQIGQNIIINEVCAGFDSAKNEFIELYNPNSAPINLSDDNFILQLVDANNNITKKKITWTNNKIPAKGYFLLVGGELLTNDKKIQSDAIFSSQLSSVSGAIIADKNDAIRC